MKTQYFVEYLSLKLYSLLFWQIVDVNEDNISGIESNRPVAAAVAAAAVEGGPEPGKRYQIILQ